IRSDCLQYQRDRKTWKKKPQKSQTQKEILPQLQGLIAYLNGIDIWNCNLLMDEFIRQFVFSSSWGIFHSPNPFEPFFKSQRAKSPLRFEKEPNFFAD